MTVERARVIPSTNPSPSAPVARSTSASARGRRVPAVVVDAHAEAARVLAAAQAKADAILSDAAASAASVAERAAREARERELARVAAELLVVRDSEEARAEREIDRTIEIAVLLAERLVGEAIAVEPSRLQALAFDALKETRGAREVRIEASPEDVAPLRQLLLELGDGIVIVEPLPELARGSLVVHTNLGRIDARLAPQLERLADALRESLRRPA